MIGPLRLIRAPLPAARRIPRGSSRSAVIVRIALSRSAALGGAAETEEASDETGLIVVRHVSETHGTDVKIPLLSRDSNGTIPAAWPT